MIDIHGYSERLERFKRNILKLKYGRLALKFLDHLGALGLSQGRIVKYAEHLPPLLRIIDFNPKEAKREDVEKVVAWINSQPYKEWTKHGYKLVLRKFIQYAKVGDCSRNAPMPEEVSWISLRVKEKDSRVTPDSLLSKEEFEAIVKAAENPRDRALVYVLFEAALRPGELLTMNVGSVEFKDKYCLIAVNGKTGIKRIPLVISFKPLLRWLEEHPSRDDPHAPLWCSLATNYKGERLSYRHFRLIIKRLARKAGIKKDVWPYLFRHSTLTNLAKVFTEARLEQYAGWVHGSEMSRRYVHFAARDLEDAVLELHGLKKPDDMRNIPRLVNCPRCGCENPPGSVHCGFCGFILDRETALKMEEKERDRERRIEQELLRMQNEINELKSLVSKLIQQASPALSSPAPPAASVFPQGFSSEQPAKHSSSKSQSSPPMKRYEAF
ncbi:tyrosine-type recombinase/integrase [Candidatus Bathyarchaeota archaeon]|nr:tyrosine-type recombinase/integrase [Candidatus Bathyarchaeota archaeon]